MQILLSRNLLSLQRLLKSPQITKWDPNKYFTEFPPQGSVWTLYRNPEFPGISRFGSRFEILGSPFSAVWREMKLLGVSRWSLFGKFIGPTSAYQCLLVAVCALLESLFFAIDCYSSLLTATNIFDALLCAINRYSLSIPLQNARVDINKKTPTGSTKKLICCATLRSFPLWSRC